MMRARIRIDTAALRPAEHEVLAQIGLSDDDEVSPGLRKLLVAAGPLVDRFVSPAVVVEEISIDEFAQIYEGAGANAPASPLERIYPRADAIALFAGTLGSRLDDATRALFQSGDPALGYVVDVIASCEADRLADVAATWLRDRLHERGRARAPRVVPYSPGYCGWHVSGQRALFDRLGRDEVGIALTASCLMDPIKSVSGVLVAGPPAIHRFRPDFPFCDACTTHSCRNRMGTGT